MTYFLEDVAKYLFSRQASNLRELSIVFPNRRARLFFNHFMSQLSDSPIWSPRFYTISDFVQKHSRQKVADPVMLVFRLFEVFRKVTGSTESFDAFYYYCQMILDDFDDIDKYLVPADKLYQNLNDLKVLEDYYEYLEESQINTLREFWEIFNRPPHSEEKDAFISIWDVLLKIYTDFNASLDADGLSYEGKLYRELIRDLESGKSQMSVDGPVAFVGFNALNRAEERLFDYFRKRGNAFFFWDYDESYLHPEYHEAGFFLRKYLKRYPSPKDFITVHIERGKQKITTVAVPSTIAQAKIIGQCLRLLNSEQVNGPLDTALILADERLLIPAVNSLPDSIDKINVSLGYPITDTPAYHLIDLLASLQKNKKMRGELTAAFYSQDVFAIYRHELLQGLVDRDEFAAFEHNMVAQNRIFIVPSDISCSDPFTRVIFRPAKTANEFVSWLKDLFENIGTHLHENGDAEIAKSWHMEVLVNVHKVLLRFGSLLEASGMELSLSVVLNLIHRMLSRVSVPFSGEPLEGLQVMGILETRTLDFKNLVILSMNEGSFPKTGHSPSFIPFALRESFGLPTIRHQDAIYSYYFYRLLHRSGQVILAYNTLTGGMQKGEASRFIQQLRYESPERIRHLNMGYETGVRPVLGIEGLRSQALTDPLDRKMINHPKEYISPSAINSFLSCKLQFYFRYIEKIREPSMVSEELEANVFGSILHGAMKILYAPFETKLIREEDIREMLDDSQDIENAIDNSFRKEYFKIPPGEQPEFRGRNLIVRSVIRSYVETILKYDLQEAPIRILALEKRFLQTLTLDSSGQKVSIGGVIDRMDEKEGVVRIIDYKTGSGKLDFKGFDQLFSAPKPRQLDAARQSLVYSWIISQTENERPVQPGLFFIRDMNKEEYDPRLRCKEHGLITDFRPYASDIRDELARVVSEMMSRDTHFTQTENQDYCGYCNFKGICMKKPAGQ
ncbi:MAG: PD-(D/E)XK nuclease family protein [Bacteroidales bacterium]|nr:PD-(D/E)XK nuclease family protein [Bacteroidales bacterium]